MHHLDLGIILLPETNGALEPHVPRRSHPERDAHGFVFTIIAAAILAVAVIAAQVIISAALTVVAAVVLRD
jgi:hypothetical protein